MKLAKIMYNVALQTRLHLTDLTIQEHNQGSEQCLQIGQSYWLAKQV